MPARTQPAPPPVPDPDRCAHSASSIESTTEGGAARARASPRDESSPAATQYHRRRPFATWVRKLAGFKPSLWNSQQQQQQKQPPRDATSASTDQQSSRPSSGTSQGAARGQGVGSKNEAKPQSSYPLRIDANPPRPNRVDAGADDDADAEGSDPSPTTIGARSVVSTARSHVAPSGITSFADNTSRTTGGMDSRRGGSTFSSPAPSERSLTTTLTTVQSSLAPGTMATAATTVTNVTTSGGGHHHSHSAYHGAHHHGAASTPSIQYHQPFPTTPASAIPPHLAPTSLASHPTTYVTATANNLLTDNASILTLASSSKRRRRRSLDTDASVRALAPSSLWGGSRESLPLSVLSASVDMPGGPSTPGLHPSSSSRIMSLASAGPDRTSMIYSTSAGAAAHTLQSERSSFYARGNGSPITGGAGGAGATTATTTTTAANGDGASVRSDHLGHGREDSISGSIAGLASPSPLGNPKNIAESRDEA